MISKSLSLTDDYKSRLITDVSSFLRKTINMITGLYLAIAGFVKERVNTKNASETQPIKTRRRFNAPKIRPGKLLRVLLLIAVVGGIVYGISKINMDNGDDTKIEVMGAKASQDINKEFSFPLKDSSGEDVSKIKYTLEKAELRDEIIVKGKRAKSVEGRTFLIVTLKIGNEYNRMIKINSRDYVRLSVNGNEDEWLAPEVHNDPVEVQAISTKYTRLGFPIYDSDTDLKLRVGEINGEKEMIPLNF